MAKVLEHNIDAFNLGRGSCFSVKIPIVEPIHSQNQKSQSPADFRPDLAQTNMTIWADNDQPSV